MLLNAGEANSTAQSAQQIQQDLLEILLALIKRLREQVGRQQQGQDQVASDGPDLDASESQTIDNLAAQSVKALVRQQGTPEITPDGETQYVYRSEHLTLSANLNDGTGYPIYTVTCANRGDLFKFQDSPSQPGEFIFYPTQHSLDPNEKADLLTRLKSSLEARLQEQEQSWSGLADALAQEPDAAAPSAIKALDFLLDQQAQAAKQHNDRAASIVRTQVEELGDQAPPEHKAVFVAHAILGSQAEYEGQHYSARRSENGTVELYEGKLPKPGETKAPMVTLASNGQVSSSLEFSKQHAAAFDAMHSKLKGSPNISGAKGSKSAPSARQSR